MRSVFYVSLLIGVGALGFLYAQISAVKDGINAIKVDGGAQAEHLKSIYQRLIEILADVKAVRERQASLPGTVPELQGNLVAKGQFDPSELIIAGAKKIVVPSDYLKQFSANLDKVDVDPNATIFLSTNDKGFSAELAKALGSKGGGLELGSVPGSEKGKLSAFLTDAALPSGNYLSVYSTDVKAIDSLVKDSAQK